MRRYLILPILLLATIARADTLPSLEELQKLLTDKNYTGLLSGTSRILQLRGPATASYHRTAIWFLKAEAQLQSNQFTPAAQSFTSGAQEKDATDEEKDLGIASAMLMKHSDRKGYQAAATREHPAPQQFDVLDPDKRKDAMAALFGVELADVSPHVDKLKDTLTPGPLIIIVKRLAELRPLERVTEKSSDKIDTLEKTIGQNFTTTIGTWAEAKNKRLDALSTLSQQQTTDRYTDNKGVMHTRVGIRGLQGQEQTEIRQMATDAKNYAGVEQQVDAAMSEVGKTAITPSQKVIQSVFDQTQTVLHAAVLPR